MIPPPRFQLGQHVIFTPPELDHETTGPITRVGHFDPGKGAWWYEVTIGEPPERWPALYYVDDKTARLADHEPEQLHLPTIFDD